MSIQSKNLGPGDCLVWTQFDRILAADTHFEFLQKLEFSMDIYPDDDDDRESVDSTEYDWVCTGIVAAFPLLAERGVSVEVDLRY
jgi:hypothetical protein